MASYNLHTLEGFGTTADRNSMDYRELEQEPIYETYKNETTMDRNEEQKYYDENIRCRQHSCNKTEKVLKYAIVFLAGMFGGQVVKKVFKD